MESNLEITNYLFENECQRIVECKDNKTGDIFIYNTIINQKLIKLIDISILNSIKSNIVKCYKTDDRLYIITKSHEFNNQKILKKYIDSNNLTMKQQFALAEQLMNLFIEIYSVTDLLQFKILNFDNLVVSEDDALYVDGYFEFKDEYDLSDNFTYRNLGNIIHYLFSKEEIVDYNISDTIHPDILKIIVKCLTREYFHPKDILKEFVNSPIYNIIYCKTNTHVDKTKLSSPLDLASKDIDDKIEQKNDAEINENINENCDEAIESDADNKDDIIDVSNVLAKEKVDDETENANVIDIYLNNALEDKEDNKETNDNKLGKVMKFIIPTFIIVFVTVVSIFLFKNLYNKDLPVNNDNVDSSDTNNTTDNSQNAADDKNTADNVDTSKDEQSQVSIENSEFNLYLNSELLKSIGYTGKVAVLDTENYNEGTSSLLIENDTDETVKVLFAVIDFTNDKLSYMKNNQIGIAAKFKSLEDVEAKLVVEAYKDNKLSLNNSGKIQIFDDVWKQKEITVKVGEIDRVNLYIEYVGKNKVWIDTIGVDILK